MKRNWLVITGIIIAVILFTIAATVAIIRWGYIDPFSDQSSFLVSVVSMAISIVALIYAMVTYYSIDRVQANNSMEGNVLCNAKYSVAYPECIGYFESCHSNDEFNRKLFDLLLYKHAKNCREYALRIQCVVDNLIWIAYAEHNDGFYEKCDELLQKLEHDRERFDNINSGLSDVLDENLKLIKYVIEYQNHKIQNSFTMSRLENIRGRILENPIASITYYDYLGLEYMRRARGLLGDNDIFTTEKMEKIIALLRDPANAELKEHYLYMLETSEAALTRASVPAENDMIWNGYISYNLARVKVMKYLLEPNSEDKKQIDDYLKTVINSRKRILYTIWSKKAAGTDGSYLNKRFQREVDHAVGLYAAFDNISFDS